ncbi:MAG: bifunctional folylpolyglutamate synthase/dihydrofolate synthase [Actinomycetia bacterium]|nr:bifunctional folylpolyglutamate synthase/dihydrofolate synthase [Actinomycetes bacterium]
MAGRTAREKDRYEARLRQVEAEVTSRWGEGRMSPTRERIAALVGLLGDPQRAYRSVHITGTNGKTSTARMIDELIRAFGLRTGRYTSPHLSSITERIVLDGEPVPARTFVEGYAELAPYLDLVDSQFDIKLSFFEVLTALAYAIFADAPVDVAVVEVGLGGEWDATNVIDGDVAVITPIGLDHTQILGDTVEQIAREKAGIIKAGASAVLAAQPPGAAAELLRRAGAVGATVAREGMEFGVADRRIAVGGQVITLTGLGGSYEEIFLPLHGAHQAQNAAVALAAVESLLGAGPASGRLELEVVREAFAAVRSPGRLEAVRAAPTILLDAAHNPHGMAATVAALAESFDFRRLIGVVGMLADKDARGVLGLLETVLDEVVVTQSSSARAVAADALAALAVEVFGPARVTVEPRLEDAIETAVRLAEEPAEGDGDGALAGAGVLITGSVVTVGEARARLVGVG